MKLIYLEFETISKCFFKYPPLFITRFSPAGMSVKKDTNVLRAQVLSDHF